MGLVPQLVRVLTVGDRQNADVCCEKVVGSNPAFAPRCSFYALFVCTYLVETKCRKVLGENSALASARALGEPCGTVACL